jgi:hypothetical protein
VKGKSHNMMIWHDSGTRSIYQGTRKALGRAASLNSSVYGLAINHGGENFYGENILDRHRHDVLR